MADNKRIDEPTGTQTVGHEWDGIEELDTPMPRWWVISFWATIIWGLAYVVLYPAIPMANSATQGVLNWTSRGELETEMKAETLRRAPMTSALAAIPVEQLANDERLYQAAVEGGRAAFKVHCVQCHGSGAAGSKGYPNLNDDDWLWGGDLGAVHFTLEHGIRQPDHDQTRFSQMPAFAGVISNNEIDAVTSYVRSLSGLEKASAKSAAGATTFANNCASCHGADGKGMRDLGAPNLADGIWLYGGDAASITTTINQARYGVMPRWNNRLDPVTIKMLAAYVHSLGGGEATPAAVAPLVADPARVAANVAN
ncbi:cytochrome-c oxidase, cbb3-type subunit III [Sphingorhabdus sp.]|uniref:cytochrome-c oxidase, cbb3-type subunit III n=1 Tax=Sphingorhabdus sp. TaxID=1902408 RepID=UPI00391BB360